MSKLSDLLAISTSVDLKYCQFVGMEHNEDLEKIDVEIEIRIDVQYPVDKHADWIDLLDNDYRDILTGSTFYQYDSDEYQDIVTVEYNVHARTSDVYIALRLIAEQHQRYLDGIQKLTPER